MEKSSTELGVFKEFDDFLKLWRGRSINEAILIDNEVDERFLPFQQSPPNFISSKDVVGFALEWARQILRTLNCPSLFADAITRLVIENYYSNFEVEPEKNIEGADDLWSKVVSQVDNVLQSLIEAGIDPAFDQRWNMLRESTDCRFSDFAIKNGRRTMEDVHVVMPQLHTLLGLQSIPPTSYYAVFDGHAGIKAAQYAATHLHQKIANIPSFKTDNLSDAIRQGVKLTDEGFMTHCNFQEQNCKSGCTVVCCFIRSDKVWLAWVGDSQGVVFSEGKVSVITTPHKPEREDERERIESSGGCVVHMGTWRVNGTLAVSRAIGDIENKPYVTSEPDIIEVKREGVDFVLLACDGMWDVLNDDDVADIAYEYFGTYAKESDGPGLAEKLVTEAKKRGSSDNITVVAVYLQDYAKLHETYIHLGVSDSLPVKKIENNFVDFGEKEVLTNKDCSFMFNSQSFHGKSEYAQEWSSAKSDTVTNSFTNFQVSSTSANDFGSFGSLSEPNNFDHLATASDETDFTRFESKDFYSPNVDIENPLRDVFETTKVKDMDLEAELGGEFDLKELEKGDLVEESLLQESFDSNIKWDSEGVVKEQNVINSFLNREETSPTPYSGSTLSPDAEPFVSRYSNQSEAISNEFQQKSECSHVVIENREIGGEATASNSNPFLAEMNLDQCRISAIGQEQQESIFEFKEKDKSKTNEEIIRIETFKDYFPTIDQPKATNLVEFEFEHEKVDKKFENDGANQPIIQNVIFDAGVMVPEVKLVYTESPYSEVPPTTFEASTTIRNESFETKPEFSHDLLTNFEDLKVDQADVALSDQESHDMEIGEYEAFKEHLDNEPNLISYELHSGNTELISTENVDQQLETRAEISSYENLHKNADFEPVSQKGDFDTIIRLETQQFDGLSNIATSQFEVSSNTESQQFLDLSNAETQQFEALSNAETQQFEALSNAETQEFEALSNAETQEFEPLSNTETQQFEPLSNAESHHFEASNVESQKICDFPNVLISQFELISNAEIEAVSTYKEEERHDINIDFESRNEVLTYINMETQPNLSTTSVTNVVTDVEDDESEDGEGWKFYSSQATNGDAGMSLKTGEPKVLILNESEINIQGPDGLSALSTQLEEIASTNAVAIEPIIQMELAEQSLKAVPKAKTVTKAKAPVSKSFKVEPAKIAITKTTMSKPSASTVSATKEVKKSVAVTKPPLKLIPKTAKPSELAKIKPTTLASATKTATTSAVTKKPVTASLKSSPAVGIKRVPVANGTANGVAKEVKPIAKTTEGTAKSLVAKKTFTATTTSTIKSNSGVKEIAPSKKSTTTAATITSKVNSGTVSNRFVSTTNTLVKADKQVKEATNKNLSSGTRSTRTTMSSAATTKLSITSKSTGVTSAAMTKTTTTVKSNTIANGSEKKTKTESPKMSITKLVSKSPVAGPSTRLSPNKITPPAAKSSPIKITSPSTPKAKTLNSSLISKAPTSANKTNRISTSTPKAVNGNSKTSKSNHVEKGTIDARSKEVLKTGDNAAEGGIADPKFDLELQNGFEKMGNGVDNVLHHSSTNGSIIVAEDVQ